MKISISIVVSMLVICSLQSAHAAEWIPELESPELGRECGDESCSPSSESCRRTLLFNSLVDKSRKLYDEKNYKESLETARYANKVLPDSGADEMIAECLAHIGRPTEAIALLKRLRTGSWRTQIEVYEALGMYEKALAACKLPDANEDPYMLKCKLLLKHGHRDQAIRLATDGYFQFDSPGNPHWRSFFQENGIPLPEPSTDPKARLEILSMIGKLRGLGEPKDDKALAKAFARTFTISGRDQLGLSYVSDEQLESPIKRIWLRVNQFTQKQRILSLEVNRGLSSPSKADIEAALAEIGTPEKSQSTGIGGDSPPVVTELLNYKLPGAQMTFDFSEGYKRLEQFSKAWPLKGVKEVTGQKWVPPTMQMVDKEFGSYHYAKAARNLMIIWENDEAKLEVRNRKRQLLIDCFEKMKKTEVADYLRKAPWDHIRKSIIRCNCDPNHLDLTLDEYMHRLWKVRGNSDGPGAHYNIVIPNYGSSDIWKGDSPELFAEVTKILGPIRLQEERQIPPLPAELMDRLEFEKK